MAMEPSQVDYYDFVVELDSRYFIKTKRYLIKTNFIKTKCYLYFVTETN